jgi:ABC-type lipoprotein export system ATPase subunit
MNPAAEILVRCTDVSRTFGTGPAAVVAVHGSTCEVRGGARIAVTGSSGSGKSTLLHLMAGLEVPTSGRVCWPNLPEDIYLRAAQIGVIFQSPSLVPALNAQENVALPMLLAGVNTDDAAGTARLEEALAAVGLADLAAQLPEELSGGQAQRIAVARVLAQQPTLILADEPTGQLDHATGQHVVDVLLDAASRLGAALVISTHDPSVAQRMNTYWAMHHGRQITAEQLS